MLEPMPRLRRTRTRTRGDRVSAAILDVRTALAICRGVWRMRRGRLPVRLASRRHGRPRRGLA
jgi:hypothetical protein